MHPVPHQPPSALWLWLAHLWTWLMHSWLYILGVLAVATLAWAYWQARRTRGGVGPWSILVGLLKELCVILLALWRPARHLAAPAARDVRRRATRAAGRGAARRPPR